MNTRPLRMAGYFFLAFFAVATISSCGVKDSAIQSQIAEAAKTAPELGGISATVDNGVVTLSGEVKDDAAKTAAEVAVKAIKGVKSVINNVTVAPPPPPIAAPVVVAPDTALTKGVTDAVKDFPAVTATVKDGVITLTGEIKRASLPKLLQSLNSLKPKKIDNQLTIK